jgi:glycosyltransferase involved in cell wall biosynthesis
MYLLLTTWWAVRRATRILTPSEASKRQLGERFGCRPEKIRVTPLAPMINERPSTRQIADTKARLGIADPYFIAVGRLETKKNTARIVEAFARVQKIHPEFRLVLVGGLGRGHEAVLAAIEKANLGDRILRSGWLGGDDLAALLAGARALVFPSLAEGFGIPILDAYTLGVPVLTSRGIATEEVAGDAAVLVDPMSVPEIAGAMQTLVTDDALRASLIERGSARVKTFSWQKTAQRTVAAFRECLEKSSS